MIKKTILTLLFGVGAFSLPFGFTADKKPESHEGHQHEEKDESVDEHGHQHSEEEKPGAHKEESAHKHDEHDEDGKEDEHGHGDEHGDEHGEEEAEEGGNIGPDKGLLSFSEKSGFVLSPEATRTFEIQAQTLSGPGPWTVPISALVHFTSSTTVFRVRSGSYKAVPISVISKNKTAASIRSTQLKPGDSVVVRGAAYLRVAEVDATSGESGHHH